MIGLYYWTSSWKLQITSHVNQASQLSLVVRLDSPQSQADQAKPYKQAEHVMTVRQARQDNQTEIKHVSRDRRPASQVRRARQDTEKDYTRRHIDITSSRNNGKSYKSGLYNTECLGQPSINIARRIVRNGNVLQKYMYNEKQETECYGVGVQRLLHIHMHGLFHIIKLRRRISNPWQMDNGADCARQKQDRISK